MWWLLQIACGAVALAAVAFAFTKYASRAKRGDPVAMLKNGLLAFALAQTMPDRIETGPIMASTREGLLPPFSGSSEINAMLSYIRDPAEFRSDPLYSAYMARKYDAVHAFLRNEFSTPQAAADFLEAFVARVKKGVADDKPS